MRSDKGMVECLEHGPQQETFVCQHIVQGIREDMPYGFRWAGNSEKSRPDAWCTSCNQALMEAGGDWNDKTEAIGGVKLLCGACYDKAKGMNLNPKKWWQIWR